MQIQNLLKYGSVKYSDIDLMQRALHKDVAEGKAESTLIVAQFEDVFTAGRKTKKEHLLDIENVIEVDRGGSVTWHGKGQLVIYPIVKLKEPADVIVYIRTVEKAVIEALTEKFNLDFCTIEGKAGVWLRDPDRKICAIGLKVAQGATMHGLALNINPSMSGFNKIIPCGLYDSGVTSLEAEGINSSLQECATLLVDSLSRNLAPIMQ